MKKSILNLLALIMMTTFAFAQEATEDAEKARQKKSSGVSVTGSNSVEFEFKKDRVEKDGDLHVSKLRENFELVIESEKFHFWYKARVNLNEWEQDTWRAHLINAFIPGVNSEEAGGESHANLWLLPSSMFAVGFGTDFGYDIGAYSFLDDEFYHIDSIWRRELAGASKGVTVATSGFALRVMPIQGLTLVTNVPLQNFDFDRGSDFKMNWGVNYTKEDIFSAGLGYTGTFDNGKNPWSMYAGVSLPVIPFVKPDLFIQTYTIGSNESAALDGEDLVYSSFDLGIRLNMEFGSFIIQPEFNASFISLNDNQKKEVSKDVLKKNYKNPIIIGIPMSYEVNDVVTLTLVPAFATGVEAYSKRTDGEVKDEWKLSFDPRIAFNTKVGTFTIRGGIIIDSHVDMGENKTKTNFLVDLGWHYRF
ncbi:MAG: hypothetical protein ACRC4W_05805 [Treponemataceae bacterium]